VHPRAQRLAALSRIEAVGGAHPLAQTPFSAIGGLECGGDERMKPKSLFYSSRANKSVFPKNIFF
jgi:hypothetical protein